jgi:arginyl-tRNA synthetase
LPWKDWSGALDLQVILPYLPAPVEMHLGEMVLLAGWLDAQIDAVASAEEPAFVAKYAFQLAQALKLFHNHHRILTENDPAKKKFLPQLSRLVEI